MNRDTNTRLASLTLLASLLLAMAVGLVTLTPLFSGSGVPGSDKTHHFLAFFALAFPVSFVRPRLAPWAAIAAIAYGGAIELIQPHVGRDMDLLDFIADGAGAVSGAAAGAALKWWIRRRA